MWIDTPTVFPACPRIIVIGDIHGDLARLLQILYAAKVINPNMQWIAEPKNTMVVQLGDQIDSMCRAPTSTPDWEKVPDVEVIQVMDQLDSIAKPHGGRVISLLGNHEWMNIMGDFSYVSEHSKRMTLMRQQKFAPNGQYSTILAKRNMVVKIGDILFCHGGILPHHLDTVSDNLHVVNEISRKVIRKLPLNFVEQSTFMNVILGDQSISWTRMYMDLLNEPEKLVEVLLNVLNRTGCKSICVGHNTVNDVTPIAGGALWLLDNGISRAYGRDSFQFLEILENGHYRVHKIDANVKN